MQVKLIIFPNQNLEKITGEATKRGFAQNIQPIHERWDRKIIVHGSISDTHTLDLLKKIHGVFDVTVDDTELY